MLSENAVMIADAEGREANWHDPWSDESDIEAAQIGGYVVRADSEPADILTDFRGAPRAVVNGHEYVSAVNRDVRVCLRHATCSEAGESCPERDDEMVLALFTRGELSMLRDSCEVTINELDRPVEGTEEMLAHLIEKLVKLDNGDVFGERCACSTSVGGVRFPHARSLHNLPQPPRVRECYNCRGAGRVLVGKIGEGECPKCEGTGQIPDLRDDRCTYDESCPVHPGDATHGYRA